MKWPLAKAGAERPHFLSELRTMLRTLWLMLGWFCMGLAVAGAVLPLIPCTPFALLAVVCFSRSSPRALIRLRRSPLIGPVLRDWERYRGMRIRAKITAVAVAIVTPLLTLAVIPQFSVALLISVTGGLVAIAIVCWLPTIRPSVARILPANEVKSKKLRRAA